IMPLPRPRKGLVLNVKGRPVPFSFWPVYRTIRRYGLQSTLFALDPWNVIVASIRQRCPASAKAEAEACVEQAQDFYNASLTAALASARPLLLYYSFMNLVKAYGLTMGTVPTFSRAQHGVSEQLKPAGNELVDAYLKAFPSPSTSGDRQIFDDFNKSIGGTGIAAPSHCYDLPKLMPQVVAGHRLWCEAADENERFIAIERISVMHDVATKELWLNIYVFTGDLSRFGITHTQFLTESQLGSCFREVRSAGRKGAKKMMRLEQLVPTKYTGRPTDTLQNLVHSLRGKIWATVSEGRPYRRYYAYLAPTSEHPEVLPQLLSIYAVVFYLGSITRYRPHHFDAILEGAYGAWIREFIIGQPVQFIYLLASEFAEQEVTKPAIV
ncbi:MAG: hypothetical protein F9K30_23850, partial [Dechloromonas sp.]